MAAPTELPSPDEPGAWRRSSFSTGSDTTCVEVALRDPGLDGRTVLVRDSTDPAGPVLRFTVTEWRVFVLGVLAGEFTLSEPGHRTPSLTLGRQCPDAL